MFIEVYVYLYIHLYTCVQGHTVIISTIVKSTPGGHTILILQSYTCMQLHISVYRGIHMYTDISVYMCIQIYLVYRYICVHVYADMYYENKKI